MIAIKIQSHGKHGWVVCTLGVSKGTYGTMPDISGRSWKTEEGARKYAEMRYAGALAEGKAVFIDRDETFRNAKERLLSEMEE